VPGVTNAQVDLAKKQAVVAGSAEQTVMAKAVAEAGFKVVG
jgi:copper chaperone CopZ